MILQWVPIRIRQLREVAEIWWVRTSLLIVLVLGIGAALGYRLNLSRSLPIGLYQVIGDASEIRRGAIVIVCLDESWAQFALHRSILSSGHCPEGVQGLGKYVVATEGDVVVHSASGLIVNDRFLPHSKPLARDYSGRTLRPFPRGEYVLLRGEVWLYSCHPAAFDSRYFGPIQVETVRSVIKPVLVAPASKRGASVSESLRDEQPMKPALRRPACKL